MRFLSCCEEILKEKKRSLALHTSLLDSLKLSLGTRATSPVLLDVGDDNSDNRPAVEWEVLSPYILICHAVLFVNFFSLVKIHCLGPSFPFERYVCGKICLDFRHLRTEDVVTSGDECTAI